MGNSSKWHIMVAIAGVVFLCLCGVCLAQYEGDDGSYDGDDEDTGTGLLSWPMNTATPTATDMSDRGDPKGLL